MHDEAGLSQGGLKAQFLPKGCTGSKYAGRLGPFIDKNSAAIVAVFTIVLAFSTILLWLHTKRLAEGADDQANKMERSITEAGRAATAMEGIATSIAANVVTTTGIAASQREFWRRQMRAYVSIIVGSGNYQERSKNIKFAGRPRVVNDGMTPAYNVKTTIKADIVKIPIDDSFDFSLPDIKAETAPALGPRQHRDFIGFVSDYVPDQDVAAIKDLSAKRALFVWSKVTYDDAFGEPHFATFAQILYWKSDGAVWGIYEPKYNNSD